MRNLPCPSCKSSITFSWADFIFLNDRGEASLFCLGCKQFAKGTVASNILPFILSIALIGGPLTILFIALDISEGIKFWLTIIGFFLIFLIRALFLEKMIELEPFKK
jgi:hypothetical protein